MTQSCQTSSSYACWAGRGEQAAKSAYVGAVFSNILAEYLLGDVVSWDGSNLARSSSHNTDASAGKGEAAVVAAGDADVMDVTCVGPYACAYRELEAASSSTEGPYKVVSIAKQRRHCFLDGELEVRQAFHNSEIAPSSYAYEHVSLLRARFCFSRR